MIHTLLTTLVLLQSPGDVSPASDIGFRLGAPASGGLLSPSLFERNHGFQYSIISGGGNTVQQSFLLNSFDLNLHESLDLRFHLDLAHTSMGSGIASPGATGSILPGLELTYRPNEHMVLHIDMGRRNYYGHSPFGGSGRFFDSPWE